ncbi:MAG: hypothetical protein HKN91_10415, partial [Acidimicrobiia bacterium]|nr:hypothetical protein [Acidimicrobiia bacterium]
MSDFDPFAVMKKLDGPVDPPETFGEELYTTLRHSMDRHAIGASTEERAAPAVSSRRGLLVAAAVVAAFFAMGGLLALLSPPAGQEASVDPLPLSEPDLTATSSGVTHNPDPSVASPAPTGGAAPSTTVAGPVTRPQNLGGYQFGGWNVLPASDFDGRLGAAVVWTGEQLIVWGGEVPNGSARPDAGWPVTNTGGAYDPVTNTWFSIPSGPLSARSGAAAVWTGSEMLVLGGQAGSAAYNPATRLWRELAAEGLPIEKATVWTGTEVIVVSGSGWGRAYDPATDRWRDLPETPLEQRAVVPTGPKPLISTVWTGEEMIVWGGWVRATGERAAQGFTIVWGRDGAAYDPATDQWRSLPEPPDTVDLSSTSAVWTGEEMIVWGANFEAWARSGPLEEEPYLAGAAYNPAIDSWRVIPTAPFSPVDQVEGFGVHSAEWIGDRMVVWAGGGFLSATGPELWAYDPSTDSWERGASSPFDAEEVQLVWTGDTLYALGSDFAYPLPRTIELPLAGAGLPDPVESANTVELPDNVPFEILALEPFVQSAFVGKFPEGQGRFYDQSDTFLQMDAMSHVVPLWDGWMTSANGEVWWFPDSISRLPIALQNEPSVDDGLQPFTYFLPTRDDLYS